MENKLLWYGYQHVSGTIHPKRYFSKQDIEEAHESPFCKIVISEFEAIDREDAIRIIKEKLNE